MANENEMGYIYTVEYLAVEKNDIMKFAVIWMVLGKKNHAELGNQDLKDKYCMFSFHL